MKKSAHVWLWPAPLVLLLDQVSKLALVRFLPPDESIPVIPGFFDLVHVRNRGMAFGLFNDPGKETTSVFLLISTLAVAALLVFWIWQSRERDLALTFGLSLILGGALGNLVDRIRLGEVIDFLDFYVGAYHWPAFNAADAAITVGTCWVGVQLLFHRDAGESSEPPER